MMRDTFWNRILMAWPWWRLCGYERRHGKATPADGRATVVVRDYLVAHFKLDDTNRIKTIGEGKSTDAPDGGEFEVMVYPAGK